MDCMGPCEAEQHDHAHKAAMVTTASKQDSARRSGPNSSFSETYFFSEKTNDSSAADAAIEGSHSARGPVLDQDQLDHETVGREKWRLRPARAQLATA